MTPGDPRTGLVGIFPYWAPQFVRLRVSLVRHAERSSGGGSARAESIEVVQDRIDQQQLAQQLVDATRADGVELVGRGGLLTGLTKTVLETALEAE